jgi:hypothetical protein
VIAFRWAASLAVAIGVVLGGVHASALAQPPGRQIWGVVSSADGSAVRLQDGSSLPITDGTRVTRVQIGTAADLQPGRLVSISARSGPGGMLEAFLVYTFAEGSTPSEGQREMSEVLFCQPGCAEGDLMTNATVNEARIDAVDAGELTISFAGQSGVVLLGVNTRVELQSPGSLADITPGTSVLGFVNVDDVATGVWVYMD